MPTSNLTKKYLLRNKTKDWYVGLEKPIKGVSLIKGPKEIVIDTPEEVVVAKRAEKEFPEHIVVEEIREDSSTDIQEVTSNPVEVQDTPEVTQEEAPEVTPSHIESQEEAVEPSTEPQEASEEVSEVEDPEEDSTEPVEASSTPEAPKEVLSYKGKRRGRKKRLQRLSEQQGNPNDSTSGRVSQ